MTDATDGIAECNHECNQFNTKLDSLKCLRENHHNSLFISKNDNELRMR